jgi:formate hydrogenlyase subunit 3/multisubunit Na+/H+ antiporter MnhD subunit
MTILFWLSIGFFALGVLFCQKRKISYGLATLGSLAALATGFYALFAPGRVFWRYELSGNISLGLHLDHLSGIFMVMAAITWLALAIYSINYSDIYPQKKLSLGFNLAIIGMMLVLAANDGLTLLIGWEVMTIFAFLMMLASGGRFERSYRFLAYGELSTICILFGFAILYGHGGGIFFNDIKHAGALFLVFVSLGFIIKMDIVPFHAWMRDIYGEIPDTAAAFLSAPVTLMGVYGLERIILLVPKNGVWSLALILLGAFSAFWGGLQAVSANKLRLLPAYSTVENNGMILSAIGFYALTTGLGDPHLHFLAVFAQAASLILVLNHTFAKTLLFMSVGHAKEAYDVHTIDEARGIWSGVGKIPALGIIVAALSFSAFPLLVGYAGEWMILETLFQTYRFPHVATQFISALAGVLIAVAIGLISFAMVKLIGYAALGYDHGRKSKTIPNRFMQSTEVGLGLLILFCGIGFPAIAILFGFKNLMKALLGLPAPYVLVSGQPVFGAMSLTFMAVVMIILLIIPLIVFLRRRKKVRKVNSWNGGILLAEEEYFTARAYSQILEHILHIFYRTREIRTENRIGLIIKDILTQPAKAFTEWIQKIGRKESVLVMNGKISVYLTYILILFIIAFIIGGMMS